MAKRPLIPFKDIPRELLENRELPHGVIPAHPMTNEEFREAFLAWADSFPQVPFLPDDRASFYEDRW